ncbi:type VI secretion system tube protein TssD [Fibrella arboris]|uniref:type VI secretion system tube protein TssD n=1 Tax=Fibrella arboris TaxID=3242486 RepID=UPI00352157E1
MASSFRSEFSVDGLENPLTLIDSSINFNQSVDRKGRASAGVRSGLLEVSILGNDRGVLTNWASDPLAIKNGWIIYRDQKGGTLQRVEFKDAYCVRYHETFRVGDATAAYSIQLGMTARQIIIDGYVHDNMWMDWKMGA